MKLTLANNLRLTSTTTTTATSPAQVIFYVITIVVALSILAFGVFIYKRALSKSSSSGKGAKYAKGKLKSQKLPGGNNEKSVLSPSTTVFVNFLIYYFS